MAHSLPSDLNSKCDVPNARREQTWTEFPSPWLRHYLRELLKTGISVLGPKCYGALGVFLFRVAKRLDDPLQSTTSPRRRIELEVAAAKNCKSPPSQLSRLHSQRRTGYP